MKQFFICFIKVKIIEKKKLKVYTATLLIQSDDKNQK